MLYQFLFNHQYLYDFPPELFIFFYNTVQIILYVKFYILFFLFNIVSNMFPSNSATKM